MGSVLGTLSTTDVLLLAVVGVFICYKLYSRRQQQKALEEHRRLHPVLPPLRKQDMTLEQLRQFDGAGPDGRICLSVNGKIFDVTRATNLYGKDGPYGIFAGRDASRGLGLLQIDASVVKDTYDDLSDLTSSDMENMREWYQQFSEKYPVVGRLLKPGEEPDVYTESEEESKSESSPTGTKGSLKSSKTAAGAKKVD